MMINNRPTVIAVIAIATLAMIVPFAVINNLKAQDQVNITSTNTGSSSTPILGGLANIQTTKNEDNQLTVEITKSNAPPVNETTIITPSGNVTQVPGGNVTVIDNGTVVIAPNSTEVSTTPSNVTVIVPAPVNQTTGNQTCSCQNQNQSQSIPPVTVIPAPGQEVNTNPGSNTTPGGNNQTNFPPQPTNQTTPPIENTTGTNQTQGGNGTNSNNGTLPVPAMLGNPMFPRQ